MKFCSWNLATCALKMCILGIVALFNYFLSFLEFLLFSFLRSFFVDIRDFLHSSIFWSFPVHSVAFVLSCRLFQAYLSCQHDCVCTNLFIYLFIYLYVYTSSFVTKTEGVLVDFPLSRVKVAPDCTASFQSLRLFPLLWMNVKSREHTDFKVHRFKYA